MIKYYFNFIGTGLLMTFLTKDTDKRRLTLKLIGKIKVGLLYKLQTIYMEKTIYLELIGINTKMDCQT